MDGQKLVPVACEKPLSSSQPSVMFVFLEISLMNDNAVKVFAQLAVRFFIEKFKT